MLDSFPMIETLKEHYDRMYCLGHPVVPDSLGAILFQVDTYEEFLLILESEGFPTENIIPKKLWNEMFSHWMFRFLVANYPYSFDEYGKAFVERPYPEIKEVSE